MISVYESKEKIFDNNGIKILKPRKATLRKEDNGDYYVTLKDDISNLEYYQAGMIIRALTPWGKQAFRLTNPAIKNSSVTVKAKHVYYDSENYVIKDSYVVDKNCNDALDHLNIGCDRTTPFNTISDILTINTYRCQRTTFKDAIDVVLERWGGHLVRDNFNIEIRNSIGEDRGVVLSYQKNIIGIDIPEIWDDVVTKILPTGKDGIMLEETYLEIEEDLYDIPYTKPISFDQAHILEDDYKDEDGNLDEQTYKSALLYDLRQQALNYLAENKFPKVNYSVSAYLNKITDIGDVIYVKHPRCKVNLTTNVIALEYDLISQSYIKIEFGNFKKKLNSLVDTVSSKIKKDIKQDTNEVVAKLTEELNNATAKIRNSMSESNVIYDGDKILIVNSLPKETATKAILINGGGIAFSQNGINGAFNSVWGIDGTFDLQQMNVINLIADMIKGGTLKLGSNLNENGVIEVYSSNNKLACLVNSDGLTVYKDNGEYVKINPTVGFAGYDKDGNKIYWADGDEFHMKKSVVEEEITLSYKLKFVPIQTLQNNGIALVPVAGGE